MAATGRESAARLLLRGGHRLAWLRHRTPAPQPRVAFVLSGGGPLGAAQVGMAAALLEAGVVPDMLVGCSVGALNAAFLAQGPTPALVEDLEQRWRGLRARDIYPDPFWRQAWHVLARHDHVMSSARLRATISDWLPVADLAELPVELHVVTTALATGRAVWHTSGVPEEVLAASAAIPGLFPPVRIGGTLHVDGGVSSLVPFRRALGEGAEHIWVLDVAHHPRSPVDPDRPSAFSLLRTGFSLALRAQHDGEADAPGVRHVRLHEDPRMSSLMDFSRTPELIDAGYRAAVASLAA